MLLARGVEELVVCTKPGKGRNSKTLQEEIQTNQEEIQKHRKGRNFKSVCLARVEELAVGAAPSRGRNPTKFR